jgi:hypothetical protein
MQRKVLRYSGEGKIVITVEGVDQVPVFKTGDKMDCGNFEGYYLHKNPNPAFFYQGYLYMQIKLLGIMMWIPT